LANENYGYWKLELRGMLLNELFSGDLREGFKAMAEIVVEKM
jgi:hypothetical protein